MEIQTLNKWADLLFDTGKRNNLVNFHTTKQSGAEIVTPDAVTLFGLVGHSTRFEVMDTKGGDDDDLFEALDDEKIAITKEKLKESFDKKLKKGQILVYNPDNKPIRALKNINKKGKTAIEETGVNIVYCAFGFINWKEKDNADTVMKAPVLLIPAIIENESIAEPCRIRLTDDEVILNPTFAYKLEHEFGIKLPEYDDEEGIESYFAKLDELLSKIGWSLSRESRVGIFSFLKINMYQDLKDNAAKIVKCENVRAMSGEFDEKAKAKPAYESVMREEKTQLVDLNNVVDADASQSEAIEMAKAGKSFVLQGPPGTGKSQTITNIIAECLACGKKVLFVSEKLAALNVVFEKLKKVGLEEFCLELHSHKANKKQLIEELCRTLKLKKSLLTERAQREHDIKLQVSRQLDKYADELHKKLPTVNKSLYELYEALSSVREAPAFEFVIKDIDKKGEDFILNSEKLFSYYEGFVPSIGYDYKKNVWYGYIGKDESYEAILKLGEDLALTEALCEKLAEIGVKMKNDYGFEPETVSAALVYLELFELLDKSEYLTPSLTDSAKASSLLSTVRRMEKLAEVIKDQRAILNADFESGVYTLDGAKTNKLLADKYGNLLLRIFAPEYGKIMKVLKAYKLDGKRPKYKPAVAYTKALRVYQEKLFELGELEAPIKELLGEGYIGVDTDFKALIAELEKVIALSGGIKEIAGIVKMLDGERDQASARVSAIRKMLAKAFNSSRGAAVRVADRFDKKKCDIFKMPIDKLFAKASECHERIGDVGNYTEFARLLEKLDSAGLLGFIDKMIKNEVEVSDFVGAYKKAFYRQWIDFALRSSPVLISLSRVPHDEMVKRFTEKDELNFDVNIAKIRALVSRERPSLDMIAQGSAVSVLLREGEKKRKQKGIRQLISELTDLVQTLKPCFLMSPLSVSTFLTSDVHFDTVIFDEASQIFPQDAIGAIYRATQLIVVGDSKQMPPSNFFSAASESDEDTEEEGIADFESILDICSTSLPTRRLKWHYRSRFEPLIAFSNKNFYDKELVTFPSATVDCEGVGIDYYHVDGVFDRKSRTNLAEAERVVELVFENIEKHPERSVGVVAFSISQQNLIERLIAKRRRADESHEAFFSSEAAEPFFVKNLETVQGDERDTIIFSIAYGRGSDGKLLMNFGPLNRVGGERRLNVAVTRAKYNVKLVSSMHYTDLDLSRSQSVGVKLLRDYLCYAENGFTEEEGGHTSNALDEEFNFEQGICEFLSKEGYAADVKVGYSAFKIDVAVKDPESGNYVMAIECDGDSYRSLKTTRDRERLRRQVLERMGWKYYRIWSTDWIKNNRVEKERLLAALKAACEEKRNPKLPDANSIDEVSDVKDKTVSESGANEAFEKSAESESFEFPTYEYVDVEEIREKCMNNVPRIVRAILEKESPISEEWVIERLSPVYGRIPKAKMAQRFDEDMQFARSVGIIRRGGFIYLENTAIPMLRIPSGDGVTREIKHIPPEELALGIKAVLERNVSLEKTSLFKLISSKCGYSRLTDASVGAMETALCRLGADISVNDGTVSLK